MKPSFIIPCSFISIVLLFACDATVELGVREGSSGGTSTDAVGGAFGAGNSTGVGGVFGVGNSTGVGGVFGVGGSFGNTTVCGNGIVETNELCDDKNTMNGDGCSARCDAIERGWICNAGNLCQSVCGDGIVASNEQCDLGTENGTGSDCAPDCTISARCGNGVLELNEVCDDGNTTSGDGCNTLCNEVEAVWL